MRAAKRVRRLSCGRWEAEGVGFPTEALARDYAEALRAEGGRPARWREALALSMTGLTTLTVGAAWALNALAVDHPSLAPVATTTGVVALSIRVGMYMKG